MSKPKLSVVSIAYNQEEFIGKALQSFVDQKTNFDYEIIIADDSSTDKTADIIREYAKEYPDLFKPILRKKNVGVQENLYDALRSAKGEYIALCEGDDFWTDPGKLQVQVDFLDKHLEYALCFHPVKVFFQNGEKEDLIYPEHSDESKFTVNELLKQNFIQTNSVVYRRQKYIDMPTDILPLDWYLHLYHAQFGKIGFINKVMSAYRRHPGGLWWDSHNNMDAIWKKHGIKHLSMYIEFLKLYGKNTEYRKNINQSIINVFNTIAAVDSKQNSKLIEKALEKFPSAGETFLLSQYKLLKDMDEEVSNLKENIHHLELNYKTKADELEEIYSSKGWKLLAKVHSTLHFFRSRP